MNKTSDFKKTVTPWAIICPYDGQVYLNEKEYTDQLKDANSMWKCPICGYSDPYIWDDDNYVQHYGFLDDDDDDHSYENFLKGEQ